MTNTPLLPFKSALETFAEQMTAKFAVAASFHAEDQLKGPVADFLALAGSGFRLAVETVTEIQVDELGRPDIGVMVGALLTGHVELKAPGKGANPARFRGHDRAQWDKFKDLPNLLYTDGNEWQLYRTGQSVGRAVRLAGDATVEGKKAISHSDAEELMALLHDFLRWKPVVPASPRALADVLAPLCRLLRSEVQSVLQTPESSLAHLAADWRKYLFPEADDGQFADAYAQTLTYALLLARLSGAGDSLSVPEAVQTIRTGHRLLADALHILGDAKARVEIETPISLLERVIAAVDPAALRKKSKGDPWLYFYEDFLAAYDPKMRKDRGVYYTPVEVVQTQVRLVSELLETRFNAEFSFVDEAVTTLDPAAGTGTYLLAALEHGLQQVAEAKGAGMRANAAARAACNLYGFELLVGPYAVAHLRLTQRILAEGGQLPPDGVHLYLTDTLESPTQLSPEFPFTYRELAQEHARAQQVKANTPILVCIGNPPYDRQQIVPGEEEAVKRKGGWVRFGERIGDEDRASTNLLQDFLKPLERLGLSVHAKNLYNDYVYFWRWALWKVFENQEGPGIVSFITASSYLRGPGFAGVRQVMRQTFDDLWIIDLEGDSLGARKSENVFAIRTPVAIAIGVRYGPTRPVEPATVHYTRISGAREEKLKTLAGLQRFDDLHWRPALSDWHEPFLPTSNKPYWDWPLVTALFPWQANGVVAGRTWPIAPNRASLLQRWQTLLAATNRKTLFKDSPTGRKTHKSAPALPPSRDTMQQIRSLPAETPAPEPIRYAFRSFDRHWLLADARLIDRPSPDLWRAHSDRQICLTSLLTDVLGVGPAVVATSLIPDKHHFSGRGAKDVIPLWRDTGATQPNVPAGLLALLGDSYSRTVSATDFFAYAYAVLASPRYVQLFWDELTIPGPRLPITKNAELFSRAVALGSRLLWLHTYGERYVPAGERPGHVPGGLTRCLVGTPASPDEYPDTFSYDTSKQELHVGKGRFAPVRPEVWEFNVSGLQVVKSWLGYRMRNRAGKKSSPLDDIRPQTWQFDDELLNLLWVLEATVDLLPSVNQLLQQVVAGDLFTAAELPQPIDSERQGPGPTLAFFEDDV